MVPTCCPPGRPGTRPMRRWTTGCVSVTISSRGLLKHGGRAVVASGERTIVVCGATGRQGGAVARHLIADGWQVRGLTRNPESAKAKKLSTAGAQVVKGDMADRESLDRAFAGVHGVYNVQNPMISGF